MFVVLKISWGTLVWTGISQKGGSREITRVTFLFSGTGEFMLECHEILAIKEMSILGEPNNKFGLR